MGGPQLQFMGEDGLVKSDLYQGVEKYAYLSDKWDLDHVKNEMWKTLHEITTEVEEFEEIDLTPVSLWFTPASGRTNRGGGFLHYDRVGGQVHIAMSLRWLDRAGMSFIKQFLSHELCHLKMYQSVGSHDEFDKEFQWLLREVGAPTSTNWAEKKHNFDYKL